MCNYVQKPKNMHWLFLIVCKNLLFISVEASKSIPRRDKHQTKWTNEENKRLLEYLLDNNDIEKPTAHLYYMKLLNKTKISATPEETRSRVRHLKRTYLKADEWRQTSGKEVVIDSHSYKRTLRKICPYYDQLAQIFPIENSNAALVAADDYLNYEVDEMVAVKSEVIDDYMEANCTSVSECRWMEDLMLMVKTEEFDDVEAVASVKEKEQETEMASAVPNCTPTSSIGFPSASNCPQISQEHSSKNSLSTLIDLLKKRGEMHERTIFNQHEKLELEKRRLDLEMDTLRKNFEIRKLGLELKERLAMEELKYKYNRK